MCGRYSLAGPDPAQVRALYPGCQEVEIRRRFNVAPGDAVLAVTTPRDGVPRGELLRWGLVPAWAGRRYGAARTINARAETVAARPAYRSAFARMRCLVLADGFYEWQPRPGAPKQPFHISARGRALFAFAGLWSSWHGGDGTTVRSCTILTTAANRAIAPLHDRMPVILDADAEAAWLDKSTPLGQVRELLAGLPASATSLRPVSTAVNDARYDGPECLADAAPAAATLF